MSAQRTRIVDAVGRSPGVHFSELVRRLDLAPGQVQYHVRKLIGDGAILQEHLYGRTHYYPPTFDEWEREAIALLRRETARDVVVYLLTDGPSRPADVADGLGIARSTLEWHLTRLIDRGLVEKHRDEQRRVTLVASHPAETITLLGAVEPSLPGRLVDRFARLVDTLLGE